MKYQRAPIGLLKKKQINSKVLMVGGRSNTPITGTSRSYIRFSFVTPPLSYVARRRGGSQFQLGRQCGLVLKARNQTDGFESWLYQLLML